MEGKRFDTNSPRIRGKGARDHIGLLREAGKQEREKIAQNFWLAHTGGREGKASAPSSTTRNLAKNVIRRVGC